MFFIGLFPGISLTLTLTYIPLPLSYNIHDNNVGCDVMTLGML